MATVLTLDETPRAERLRWFYAWVAITDKSEGLVVSAKDGLIMPLISDRRETAMGPMGEKAREVMRLSLLAGKPMRLELRRYDHGNVVERLDRLQGQGRPPNKTATHNSA
jgi:hypothetical protein